MKPLKTVSSRNLSAYVYGIAGLFLILQWVPPSDFGFHRDELLYLSLGMHPSFGYFSVPPLIGWIAGLSGQLWGTDFLAARFFPALTGGLLILMTARIAGLLGGKTFAQILTAVAVATSIVFVRAFGMLQPVCFDIFFWTLILYFFLKFHLTSSPRYLLWMGIATGVSLLNKYNPVFLILSFLLVLPFTSYRKVFGMKETYFGALFAFLIFLPNLIWQANHDFPVFTHMKELQQTQLVNMQMSTFLVEQLLMVFPSTLLILPGLAFVLIKKTSAQHRIFPAVFGMTLALYLLTRGKSYYSAGIYPFMIALSAVAFEKTINHKAIRGSMIALLMLCGILLLPGGKPVLSRQTSIKYFDAVAGIMGTDAFRRDEDNRYQVLPQDYADMLGWKELAEKVNQARQSAQNPERCLIYCENYGQAGAVTVYGKPLGFPRPLSFHESFSYWNPTEFPFKVTEMVYVNDSPPGEDVYALFGTITKTGQIDDPLAREYGTGIYLCQNPKTSFNDFWQQESGNSD